MSGIGVAVAAGVSASAPPPPSFSVSVSFTGGDGPFNVSGASGDLYTQFGAVISVTESGGTTPYSGEITSIQSDPSGKISVVAASDHVHNTIGWSGLALNELESCYVEFDAHDAVGASDSARYPPVGQIIVIKRTS